MGKFEDPCQFNLRHATISGTDSISLNRCNQTCEGHSINRYIWNRVYKSPFSKVIKHFLNFQYLTSYLHYIIVTIHLSWWGGPCSLPLCPYVTRSLISPLIWVKMFASIVCITTCRRYVVCPPNVIKYGLTKNGVESFCYLGVHVKFQTNYFFGFPLV